MWSEKIKRGVLVSAMVFATIAVATAQDQCDRDCKGCNGAENCDQCQQQCRAGKGTGTNLHDAFQTWYASNLNLGDSVVNITNSGVRLAPICVNVYAFSPDEQMISCCTCPVTPDGLVSLSVRRDLTSNTLTPAVPNSIVVKLLASEAGGSCDAAASPTLTSGLAAWGTTIHAALGRTVPTERTFSEVGLSTAELNRLTSFCAFIQSNGSGLGICRSCRLGGLGATKNR